MNLKKMVRTNISFNRTFVFAFPQPVINNNIYIFHNIDNLIKYIIITVIMSQIYI